MKKKNIGFILFGVAAADLISSLVVFFIFPAMFERMGLPQTPVMNISILIVSLVSFVILIIGGIILLIKFRHEE